MSVLTKILFKNGSNLPSKITNILKGTTKEIVKNKAINSVDSLYKDINNGINKETDNMITGIKSFPKDMIQEYRRSSHHELNVIGSSAHDYNYFKSYYNANTNRATSTPTPNLAEWFRLNENRDRYIIDQYLKNRPTY